MIYAVCIGKARDGNNNITQYKLRDFTGQETIFDARGLKDYISNGRISVCNLTLTSDNKLMEKKVESLADLGNNERVKQTNMGNYPNIPSVIPEQHSQHRGGMGQSAPTNSVDPSNAYKINDMLYYVTREGNLNIKHIPSNTEETLVSKVGTACFVPIRAKENGTVTTVGMLAFDMEECEHFFLFRKGINAARSLSRLMSALTYSGNNTVPLTIVGCDDNTLDLRCTGKFISLNKKLQMIECAIL